MALLSRLFLLVAVALLPAIAIQSYNEFELRHSRQMEVQEQTLGLARLAAAQQQQIVGGIRGVLTALSELPSIKARAAETCGAYLSTIKRRYPAFLSFAAVDMSGQSFCTTNGKTANVGDRSYFVNATRTGEFTVGEFAVGRLTGSQLIPFALPFYDDNRMEGVVIATLNLDWLADFIAQMGIPPGAALAIADRNGTYLARYPDGDRFVGRKMPDDQYVRIRHAGTATAIDVDKVERIIGYSPLQADSGELLVTFGVDKAQAFAEIQRRTQRGILLIVLSASLAFVLTWLGARRFIHGPVAQLVDAANRWRLGNYSRRVHIQDKCAEITKVADAFNSMANALAQRERELYDAKVKAEEAAARITTIFESTTDCVIIIDRDWRIGYLNDRAKVQLCEERELVGLDFWEAFPDALDPCIATHIHEAMSGRRLAYFEIFCDLRARWYEINAFPSGEGLAILFRNITEHKHAVEARRVVEEQLHQSQKMEAVGQLTGGVAHDFNNLLMVITGNLELIENRAADKDSVRELAQAARSAAERGASLTTQLLAFSRRQKLNPKPLYANTLIRDFQKFLRRAIGESCEVKLVADDHLWPCHVDPSQLQAALLNLTLNARDAMPDGGMLMIELRNVTLEDDSIPGVAAGPYVSLSVTDAGCGIAPQNLDRVFDPFFTTKEVGKGTGLGLSMVYGFVRQSGGHVAIESEVGQGTTVKLYLPRSTQAPRAEPSVAQMQDPPVGRGRVLVVEDDDDVLYITSAMLRDFGYQVICARNGREAMQILKAGKRFDLLFSDVVMPKGITGVELAREAKRLCLGIKVLLTSGNAADVLARHRAEDEFPIIGKPFRRTDLAQYLRLVMREAS
jgi:signal transduction histidine kinase/HAMP domain-containing protein